MKVTYSDKIKQAGNDYVLLQRAMEYLEAVVSPEMENLEAVVGPPANSVSAYWDSDRDENGRTRYTLHVAGFSKSVSASFYPSELRNEHDLHFRLLDLCGDLLETFSTTK